MRHCGAVPREPRPRSAAALAGTVVATGVVAAGAAVVGAPDWFGLAGERPFVWTVKRPRETAPGIDLHQ